LVFEQPSPIICVEPRLVLSSPLPDGPPTASPCWVVPVCCTCRGTDTDADGGDRTYLVLAKPNVIMNECAVKCTLIEWR
jgi:hypothetical protein